MKHVLVIILVAILSGCKQNKTAETPILKEAKEATTAVKQNQTMQKQSIHQFKVKDLHGEVFDFSTLKGKKAMLVNTASQCGYTPQYKDLQELYNTYKNDGFVVVGFPANNFGSQEPGTNTQIAAFCEQNYGVTFPMMGKISVKGDDTHEVYQFLTQKDKNGVADSKVDWNFHKFLIDENGYVVRSVPSKVVPTDASIVEWIKG